MCNLPSHRQKCSAYPLRIKLQFPSPPFCPPHSKANLNVQIRIYLSTFGSIRRGVEMSEWGGKKICGSLPATFPFSIRPGVGSDWLERRLDVIPWTGRSAPNGEVLGISMWSAPACLLSRAAVSSVLTQAHTVVTDATHCIWVYFSTCGHKISLTPSNV